MLQYFSKIVLAVLIFLSSNSLNRHDVFRVVDGKVEINEEFEDLEVEKERRLHQVGLVFLKQFAPISLF